MAIESILTEDQKKYAVDLTVTMVVNELANDLHIGPEVLLPQFIASKTGSLLYDEESKLWWSEPSDIVDMYKAEISSDPR